jgi:hypothetical protein
VGNLGLPQVYGLLSGFNSIESRKAEATKSTSSGAGSTRQIKGGSVEKQSVDSIHQLRRFPGIQYSKRKK